MTAAAHRRAAFDPVRRPHRGRGRDLRGARGRGALADRPERRRQDVALQCHHRLSARRPAATSVFRGRRLTGLKPHAIAALGVVRTFQKTSLFGGRERARQRADRPASALAPAADRHHARPALGGARRSASCGPRRGTSCAFMGLEARAREAGRLAALWRAAPARGRDRARRAAQAAAARRAGVGHEPGGEGALHGNAGENPRARHHGAAGRARHAHGDGRVRPRRSA